MPNKEGTVAIGFPEVGSGSSSYATARGKTADGGGPLVGLQTTEGQQVAMGQTVTGKNAAPAKSNKTSAGIMELRNDSIIAASFQVNRAEAGGRSAAG